MLNETLPSYCRKKNSTGKYYAYVYINGNRIGLGQDGPEAKQKYEATIAEWLANGKHLHTDDSGIKINELCKRYLDFAKGYYGNSTEYENYERVSKILIKLYGKTNAGDFGPKKLKAVRGCMIQKGWLRKSINKQTQRTRAIFRWAEANELIERGMIEYLSTLAPLKKGRCPGVPEGKKVKPVPIEDVEAIQLYVSRQVWAMVQLQLLTGARPGEIVILRLVDIDRSENVWIFRPENHKNEHRDIEREIYIGKQAQTIIARFLFGKSPDDYIFPPADANREAKQRNAVSYRRKKQKASLKLTNRCIGDHYTTNSYRRAIKRGCEIAGVTSWSPNQLRHNAATIIRKEFGLEAAQIILGHTKADVTQIYAERDREKAVQIAAILG